MTSPRVLHVTPIGTLHTPFPDRASAPRQPAAARGAKGTIELHPDGRHEHALSDIESFPLIWVLFWFHLNEGWRGKVLPPRSATRRGVFATRSPYRPNPIGLSVLRLERVEGLVLHVLDVDMIDGTPVIDIKPYLPYTDAVATTGHGWLDEGAPPETTDAPVDPKPRFDVVFTELATEELAYLAEHLGVELEARIREVLSAGPSPHPYRRIRKAGDGFQLAVREWRVAFGVAGAQVTVERIHTGYRASALFGTNEPSLDGHRAYSERYGIEGDRPPKTPQ
ncbi:MAG TPA: tRNA (N6-threonylcarbamoyladenosine(37)-N6)-methyltransferase TrmO [Polyangiaceae bacterium]|nr:tRNA (N6-threonylcarbamoyladenosine(37)-N6)-methyltransferase TrmO [Polyangiaceae bacterium]